MSWAGKYMENVNVAVIDDDDMVADMLVRLIKRFGGSADIFNDAELALNAILANPEQYKIVFCDFHLPIVSGPDLLKRLSDAGVACRSYLMTGGGDDVDETNDAYAAFCQGVLAKPFDFAEIGKILKADL